MSVHDTPGGAPPTPLSGITHCQWQQAWRRKYRPEPRLESARLFPNPKKIATAWTSCHTTDYIQGERRPLCLDAMGSQLQPAVAEHRLEISTLVGPYRTNCGRRPAWKSRPVGLSVPSAMKNLVVLLSTVLAFNKRHHRTCARKACNAVVSTKY